ncbi:MAG: DUF3160 domain-containing protein, partial [Candidatus Hodarchaeales archaeon]
ELQNWSERDKQSLSWKWIESLRHLTHIQPEFNETQIPVVPEFMKTGVWLDEKLTTVLGSWAQMKHDMILYAKQGFTNTVCSTPEGYVEPYPLFYNALRHLNKLFKDSITQFESLGFNTDDQYYFGVFDSFDKNLKMLETIAYHELQGVPLTEEEKEFILDTYSENRIGSGDDLVSGWLGRTLGLLRREFRVLNPFPNSRASLIADIHTDLNTGEVLEVATGLLEHLIAIVPGWNNAKILAVGPVFSYYEFNITMDKRMTDEEWRGIIELRIQGEHPENDFEIFEKTRGFWAQSYMVSTEMTTSMIYYDKASFNAPEWFITGDTSDIGSSYPDDAYKPSSFITFTEGSPYTTTQSSSSESPYTTTQSSSSESPYTTTQSSSSERSKENITTKDQISSFTGISTIIISCLTIIFVKKSLSRKKWEKLNSEKKSNHKY